MTDALSPSEIRSKVDRIKILTRRQASGRFSGEYRSAVRGRGMEFDQVRSYQVGDDVRSLDWNVTARTGEPHVKTFIEERELTVIFAVDLSSSGDFGTAGRTKRDLAAEIVAVLATSAAANHDNTGLLTFTDRVESFVVPRKGRTHTASLIREVLSQNIAGRGTSVELAIETLSTRIPRHSVIFFISDFRDTGWENRARILAKSHDVIALHLTDPADLDLPKAGILPLFDPETGKTVMADTSSRKVRSLWRSRELHRRDKIHRLWTQAGADHLILSSDEDWVHALALLFSRREAKR